VDSNLNRRASSQDGELSAALRDCQQRPRVSPNACTTAPSATCSSAS